MTRRLFLSSVLPPRINTLRFYNGNAKLNEKIKTFSLPAGWTCPNAFECLAKTDRKTGKIIDGPHAKYRCFAASTECYSPDARESRWYNFDLLRKAKTRQNMAELIHNSIPKNSTMIRIHVSGDFFNESYFLAWVDVAKRNPRIIFYGYTKMVSFLVEYKNILPRNFRFVASFGGTEDCLILRYNVKNAQVVTSEQEAKELELELDHKDDHVYNANRTKSFALLLHGTQQAGSVMAKIWQQIRINGKGYNRNRRKFKESTVN